MRCFYHGDVEAVAVCKSCGRAICHDCYAEVGAGSACRNRCESDVTALNEIIERNKTVYRKTSAIYVRNGFFILLIGLVFSGFGVFIFIHSSESFLSSFFIILGVLFCLFGVSSFYAGRRLRAK